MKKNFINIISQDFKNLNLILKRAKELKRYRKKQKSFLKTMDGKVLVMIFEIPSTRTRVSFELAISELGGKAIILESNNTHLSRGETTEDTARVLDRYCDVFMLRTTEHKKFDIYAKNSNNPIINGLSNICHPCQVMSDIMTFEEHRGSIKNKKISWLGDNNNVLHSWIEASLIFDFELSIAFPETINLSSDILNLIKKYDGKISVTNNPIRAVSESSCVVTDTWLSMGEKKLKNYKNIFSSLRVDEKLMQHANKDALFMHCLPAHRGEEVTNSVIEGPNSVVWDEAENRLHVQKAILEWCLGL